jgi:tetratricopeptide (TPR) repeat protein/transglutaminase-like putative cysteine protease
MRYKRSKESIISMSRSLAALLLLCSLSPVAFAQKQIDETAGHASVQAAGATSKNYPDESYVIEQMRTSYRFENDGTGRKETIARVRVQSEAGVEQWGQLVVGYNSANEKVEISYVRVRKKDGTVVTAPETAVQDLTAPVEREAPVYTDFRQKHVTVPGLRPDEVLEYDLVTVIHTPLASGQFWTEYDFDKNSIILDEQLDIDIPKDRAVKLKTKPGRDPKITEANGRRRYHWESSHLVREDDKKDKDARKKPKKKPDEFPAVQMTTFTSWEQVGRWYATLEHDRRQPAPEIRAKADELTKGLNTDLERTQALYDYVAKNFRYVSLSLGLGRYQPHAASDVLHNQYGDCKDKHTLLASLLEAKNLHASSVLINSGRKLDPDMPSPSQFDHVITLLPLNGEEVWMDTTTEVAPFRLLSFNIRKKQGLVIPVSGTPHLEETPADPPFPNTQVQVIDGTVNEIGKLNARISFVVRGDTELLMRMIFRRVPNSQWQHLVETMNNMAGLDGDISNLKVGDPAATREPFEFSYDIAKPNYLDWSKKKFDLDLPLAQFSLADADEDDVGSDADPIQFGPPGTFTYRVKLVLPSKYQARAPLPFSMKRDYADYNASYKVEGTSFTAERTLVMRQRDLPADRTPDYLAFRRAVLSDLGQHLSVETTAAGTLSPPPGMKADELDESGRAAMRAGNFSLAVDLFKRAVEAEPKHKYAWNNLGLVYLAMRKNDDAIAAFKKAGEVNPYDQFAWNNLGRAYWQERKYDDAAAAFHKQLEVNPLDKFAHGNLGQMYAEWHKYSDAVPELEKAVSLSPDDPSLQVSLGDAYLNLGEDEKAISAFDRAVEISATPLVWNNIAYQLSLKNAHLDKAQQYAESAVAATSAALRNLTVDQVSQRDLGLVPSLIAYWDTLGWVLYARGKLNKADEYISAAWTLGQHGEVGDHLGQVYEKLGEKDKARQTYALALNGLRPVPETRERLAALVGGDNHVPAEVEKTRLGLQQMRTLSVPRPGTLSGNAEFLVMLTGGSSGIAVDGVKFLSGDEKLRGMVEPLRHAKFPSVFPDSTPTKIFRRGVLDCSGAGHDCTFVMLVPDDVRSVD